MNKVLYNSCLIEGCVQPHATIKLFIPLATIMAQTKTCQDGRPPEVEVTGDDGTLRRVALHPSEQLLVHGYAPEQGDDLRPWARG